MARSRPTVVLTVVVNGLAASSHGVADFPDPSAQGKLSLQMISAAGVDLRAPSFLTAARACVGVTHGVISMAAVEQAINHRG